jgi:hypothetical protein
MSKKLIGGLAVAAALCMAAPAWANHGGHGDGYSNGHGNGYGHWKHGHRHQVRERVVVREHWRSVPVYQQAVYPAYPAPAPGIQIVLPHIFIPFR